MAIEIKCLKCGAELTVDDKFAGKKGRCPGCNAVMIIPKPGEKPQGVEPKTGPAPEKQPEAKTPEAPQPKPQAPTRVVPAGAAPAQGVRPPQGTPPAGDPKVNKAPLISGPSTGRPVPPPPRVPTGAPRPAPPRPPQQRPMTGAPGANVQAPPKSGAPKPPSQPIKTAPTTPAQPPQNAEQSDATASSDLICSTCKKAIDEKETFSRVGKRTLCDGCYRKEFGLSEKKSGDPILDEIGLDIPGMVVLKGKEERYIGRLLQDQTAREIHRREGTATRRAKGDIPGEKRLMDFLFKQGIIDGNAVGSLRAFMINHGCSLVDAVTNLQVRTAEEIGTALAEEMELLFSSVDMLEVNENVYSLVSHDIIRSFGIVPISKTEGTLTVAIANPYDKEALDELSKVTGMEIDPIICTESCITKTIEKYFKKPK